jgi:hypothetical protein
MNDPDAQLQVIVEKRGKREDASLLSYYNEVFDRGKEEDEVKKRPESRFLHVIPLGSLVIQLVSLVIRLGYKGKQNFVVSNSPQIRPKPPPVPLWGGVVPILPPRP